jgi:uncharacterized protein YbjT (DUF2867 family)
LGADTASRSFYLRTKGEIERDIEAARFPSLVIVRPSLLGGERAEARTAEGVFLFVTKVLGPLLPAKWRISQATRVAAALVNGVAKGLPGRLIVSSEELARRRTGPVWPLQSSSHDEGPPRPVRRAP